MPDSSLFTPQRQSIVAALFIIWKFIKLAFKSLLPLIAIIAIQGKTDEDMILMGALAFMAFLLVRSLLTWYRYTFHLTEKGLVIEQGIFARTSTEIPYSRIQSVDFEQNVLRQILQVVKLKLDSAGSKDTEMDISAISRTKAEAIRDHVLKQKELLEPVLGEDTIEANDTEISEAKLEEIGAPLIVKSEGDLFKTGLSRNHLQGLAWLFAGYFWLQDSLGKIFKKEIAEAEQRVGDVASSASWQIWVQIFLGIVLFSLLFSLVRTVLTYYGMKLQPIKGGLKWSAGLFNRKERSTSHEKIQFLQWSTQPLQRIFGMFDMRLARVGKSKRPQDKYIFLPGLYQNEIKKILTIFYSDFNSEDLSLQRISHLLMIRKTLFFGVIPAAGFAIAAHFFWPIPFWVFLFWIPIKFWMDLRYHQKFAYTLTDEFIYIRSGVFGLKNKLCKLYKVQTVNLNETPYQHRKGLADLVIYTASGKFRIPYIEREKAIEMRDLILDRLERSEQAWM